MLCEQKPGLLTIAQCHDPKAYIPTAQSTTLKSTRAALVRHCSATPSALKKQISINSLCTLYLYIFAHELLYNYLHLQFLIFLEQ